MGFALAEQSGSRPHTGPWTIEAVEALPEDGYHYEILTPGVLTVSPAPGTRHQRASIRLATILAPACPADLEVIQTINIEFPGGLLCEPDIAIVETAFADTEPIRYPPERVRAVVEIVSPGSHPQDRIIKPRLYADAGIPVYWRLELDKAPRLIVSELRRGRYVQVVTAAAGTRAAIDQPYPVELDPADLVGRAGG